MGQIRYSYVDRKKREQLQESPAPAVKHEGEEILDRFFDGVIRILEKFLFWYGIPFTLSVILAAWGMWWR